MNTIAIDCGASFLKGALFDNGSIVLQKQMPSIPVHGDDDVLVIVQIEKLIDQVKELIGILSRNNTKVKLCISNEMHGFILVKADGTPYTDYISWQKEYGNVEIAGASSVAILANDKYKEDIKYSGMGLRGGLPSANLMYLYRCGYLNIDEPLYFYTLGDYIIRRLSGREPICHPTNAAATGLYDFRTGDWSTNLLSYISGKLVFPKIGMAHQTFTIDDLEIECLPAIGDQQAALLGAGLESLSDISFNLGTGAQVSCLVEKFERDDNFSVQIRPFFGNKFLRTMPHLPSGRAMNVYVRFIEDIFRMCEIDIEKDRIWSGIQRAMANVESSNLSLDMSFFQNPITSSTVGSITNIGEYDLTLGNLFYSMYRQMASNFLKSASIIAPSKDSIRRIVFSGGVARKNALLRQFIVNSYSETVKCVVSENETLIGLNIYGRQ